MVDPAGEWKFRLDAAQRETEALRSQLAAQEAAALEAEAAALNAKLTTAEAEIRRLRAKVNALLELLAEPEEPAPPFV
jgi:uncharacterized protein YicC (UPF0701 family)